MLVIACILFYNADFFEDKNYDADLGFRKRILWASAIGTIIGLIIPYLPKF